METKGSLMMMKIWLKFYIKIAPPTFPLSLVIKDRETRVRQLTNQNTAMENVGLSRYKNLIRAVILCETVKLANRNKTSFYLFTI